MAGTVAGVVLGDTPGIFASADNTADLVLNNGVLIHYPAIYSVYEPRLDEKEQIECAAWGMKQFASQGVTCIHDNFCPPKYAATYGRSCLNV